MLGHGPGRLWVMTSAAWLALWGGATLLFLAVHGVEWSPNASAALWLFGSGALAGVLVRLDRRVLVVAMALFLTVATVSTVLEWWFMHRSFYGSPERIAVVGATLDGPVQRFEGIVGATRTWTTDGTTVGMSLTLEARAVPPRASTRSWQPIGSGAVRYLTVAAAPLSGRTFRISVPTLNATDASLENARIVVSDQHGVHRMTASFSTDPNSGPAGLVWTAPESLMWSAIVITVTGLPEGFDGLGPPAIEERVDGAWHRPLAGSPLAVRFSGRETAVALGTEWTSVTARAAEDAKRVGPIEARVTIGSGYAVEIRNVRVVSDGPPALLRSEPHRNRVTIAGTHPNLVAHTVATVLIAFVALARSVPLRAAFSALTLLALVLLGSRAAILGAAVGLIILLVLGRRATRRRILVAIIVPLTGIALLTVAPTFVRNAGAIDVASRPAIWVAALDAFWAHPWQGVGPDVGAYWRGLEGAGPSASHAHNLWLQFGAAFGIPGVIGILWATAGLAWLAWRWGRFRALAIVGAVFTMNLFDFTLFYVGVLLPTAAALNAFPVDHDAERVRKLEALSGTDGRPSGPRSGQRRGA